MESVHTMLYLSRQGSTSTRSRLVDIYFSINKSPRRNTYGLLFYIVVLLLRRATSKPQRTGKTFPLDIRLPKEIRWSYNTCVHGRWTCRSFSTLIPISVKIHVWRTSSLSRYRTHFLKPKMAPPWRNLRTPNDSPLFIVAPSDNFFFKEL